MSYIKKDSHIINGKPIIKCNFCLSTRINKDNIIIHKSWNNKNCFIRQKEVKKRVDFIINFIMKNELIKELIK